MTEIKQYLTKNDCYISNGKLTEDRGVLIHSTATPGATPENFAKSWNTNRPGGRQVCVHAFSDDTKVINTLPYNMRCWGCGGSGNNYYVQIEICEPKGIYFENGWEYKIKDGYEQSVKEYIRNAVEVVAEWAVNRLIEMEIYKVDKNTITSHYEGYKNGIASNHGDPKGLLGLAGLSMDDIRNRASEIMKHKIGDNKSDSVDDKSLNSSKPNIGDEVKIIDGAVQFDGKAIPNNYVNKVYKIKSINNKNNRTVLTINDIVMYAVDLKYLVKYDTKMDTFTSYKVRITDSALNIRKGPGTSYPIVSVIKDRGIYTIIEVDRSGKWGKLKSGIGWIHLSYTNKV